MRFLEYSEMATSPEDPEGVPIPAEPLLGEERG